MFCHTGASSISKATKKTIVIVISNSCLLRLEWTLMKAVRMSQNSQVAGRKTKQ